jgi:hypothetical protein
MGRQAPPAVTVPPAHAKAMPAPKTAAVPPTAKAVPIAKAKVEPTIPAAVTHIRSPRWAVPVTLMTLVVLIAVGGAIMIDKLRQSGKLDVQPDVDVSGSGSLQRRPTADFALQEMDSFRRIRRSLTHQEVDDLKREWLLLAKTGELDIYTCLGLSFGTRESVAKKYLPQMFMLFVMHVILPTLLLIYEANRFHFKVANQDLTYRLVGFLLYSFSICHMYIKAVDECRSLFLRLALYHDVSLWYVLPMIFGELINATTAFAMTIVLFFVFCETQSPAELLVKCVAINFVIEIDNDWVTEFMREEAIEQFQQLQFGEEGKKGDSFEVYLQRITNVITFCLKMGGTFCTGLFLGLFFFFAKQDEFCSFFYPYWSWPLCET